MLIGVLPTSLALSPPGWYAGGHPNPVVTVALRLLAALAGRAVVPYVAVRAAGSPGRYNAR
ncbi:hypothetical protein ACGF8B_31245 [Streptomyces sp. NPDC047917]|uniref:hypothetical protein n=1 Tax=Streptomyces sp. NPDC047917 TaxID=3365491 RepID=UPI00371EAE0E